MRRKRADALARGLVALYRRRVEAADPMAAVARALVGRDSDSERGPGAAAGCAGAVDRARSAFDGAAKVSIPCHQSSRIRNRFDVRGEISERSPTRTRTRTRAHTQECRSDALDADGRQLLWAALGAAAADAEAAAKRYLDPAGRLRWAGMEALAAASARRPRFTERETLSTLTVEQVGASFEPFVIVLIVAAARSRTR